MARKKTGKIVRQRYRDGKERVRTKGTFTETAEQAAERTRDSRLEELLSAAGRKKAGRIVRQRKAKEQRDVGISGRRDGSGGTTDDALTDSSPPDPTTLAPGRDRLSPGRPSLDPRKRSLAPGRKSLAPENPRDRMYGPGDPRFTDRDTRFSPGVPGYPGGPSDSRFTPGDPRFSPGAPGNPGGNLGGNPLIGGKPDIQFDMMGNAFVVKPKNKKKSQRQYPGNGQYPGYGQYSGYGQYPQYPQ